MMQLSDRNFMWLLDYIHSSYGIDFGQNKKEYLSIRAKKIIEKYGLISDENLLNELRTGRNNNLVQEFVNLITINKTDFFRETPHFDFMINDKHYILQSNPSIMENNEIRVWSAACSSGEEPYSIAMTLNEAYGDDIAFKILATDIDSSIIAKAQRAEYDLSCIEEIPKRYQQKYFTNNGKSCNVNQDIRSMVVFRHFNLMEVFPFRKKFDIIFCRNVMIYFDKQTQVEIVKKMYEVLNKGGLLFTGHSEALPDKTLRFKYIKPAIYMKY